MELWRGGKLREYPKAVFERFSDNARIHKNLLPYGLRIFLAQNRMFFGRRIAVDTPLLRNSFRASKNLPQRADCEYLEVPLIWFKGFLVLKRYIFGNNQYC